MRLEEIIDLANRLEEIRDLANRIERERLTVAKNLSKAGASAEEVLDKLSESMSEMMKVSGELSVYVNNVVINTIGVSAYNAPLLVGALLATADAICDGVAKGDEGTAEHLMRAARDVAGFLAERRQVRVVVEKEDET
jgi:hypothetical protein